MVLLPYFWIIFDKVFNKVLPQLNQMTTAPEPKPKPGGDGVNLELLIANMQQRIEHVISIKEQPISKYPKRMGEVGYTKLQQINLLDMAEKCYKRDLDTYKKGTTVYGD